MLSRLVYAVALARRGLTGAPLSRQFAVSTTRINPESPLPPTTDEATAPVPAGMSEEELFSPANIRGLSPVEVARMRVVYGFVKEHADVVQNDAEPVEHSSNPLIDPRSVRVPFPAFIAGESRCGQILTQSSRFTVN
jgi:hypothetical protein